MHVVTERRDDSYSGSMSACRTRAYREGDGGDRSQTACSAACRRSWREEQEGCGVYGRKLGAVLRDDLDAKPVDVVAQGSVSVQEEAEPNRSKSGEALVSDLKGSRQRANTMCSQW
jgi:hypothetical protein